MLTLHGPCVVSLMMWMYALEARRRGPVPAFASGCALSSSYGFPSGTWPFGVVEGLCSRIVLRRYLDSAEAPA